MTALRHIWRDTEKVVPRRSGPALGAAFAAVGTNMTGDGRMAKAPSAAGVDPKSMRNRRAGPTGHRYGQTVADLYFSSMFWARHKIA